MADPRVTVIMSVYNGAATVGRAVDSIRGQSFSDFVFYITDDGSTDGTPDILRHYADRDARITVISQENRGLTKSLNNMTSLSRGEFLARMDADDVSAADRLQTQYDLLTGDPGAVMAGCWFSVGNSVGRLYERKFPDSDEILKKNLSAGINCFAHGGVMFRRAAIDALPAGYRLYYGQDFDLWLRFAEIGRLRMAEKLLYWRGDTLSTISASVEPRRRALMNLMLKLAFERRNHGKEITDWAIAEKEIFSRIPAWNDAQARAYRDFISARAFLAEGNTKDARRLAWGALLKLPARLKFYLILPLLLLPGPIVSLLFRLRDFFGDRASFMRRFSA